MVVQRFAFVIALGLSVGALTAAGVPQGELGAPRVRILCVSPAPVQPVHDSAVLFSDDFEQAADPASRYFEYSSEQGSFVRSAGDGYGGQGAAMKCQFARGQVSAGSLKVLFGRNPFGKGIRPGDTFREIYWRVYVRHQPGWEGNPAKLARATCLAGSDWSQGFIAHVWGGKDNALCIDPATGIVNGRKVTQGYNDFAHLHWLGLRNGHTPLFSIAESGRWICVESHIRLNTPGKSNGVFELWVDGQPEAARTDLDWHGAWNDYAINAVFLENYWNTGSVKPQARWFDNLVISTRPIGPIVASATPVLTRTAAPVAAWQAEATADPNGKDIVWTSRPVAGASQTLPLDSAHGAFEGIRAGAQRLAANRAYWVRVREQNASGAWSAWSAWHAPFRTSL